MVLVAVRSIVVIVLCENLDQVLVMVASARYKTSEHGFDRQKPGSKRRDIKRKLTLGSRSRAAEWEDNGPERQAGG
jgi:hypothetical protein